MKRPHFIRDRRMQWPNCMPTGYGKYREAYGIYACNGILFSHESPVRGETFVTRKITRALPGSNSEFRSGSFWAISMRCATGGMRSDYVEMQWLMLQQEEPEDFVIATGEQHSVRDFVNIAARELGMRLRWSGEGIDEKALDDHGVCRVQIDPRYFRPAEVQTLLGDATKARVKLGWQPRVSFEELVREMVEADLDTAERDDLVKSSGYKVLAHHDYSRGLKLLNG